MVRDVPSSPNPVCVRGGVLVLGLTRCGAAQVIFWATKCFGLFSQPALKANFNLTAFTRTCR